MIRIPLVAQFFALLVLASILLYVTSDSQPMVTPTQPVSSTQTRAKQLLDTVSAERKNSFVTQDLSEYLTVANPELVSPGVTIIPLSGPDRIWAITEQGILINEWSVDAERARLLPSGAVLVGFGSKFRDEDPPWKDLLNSLAEISWAGKLVWSYTSDEFIHHDHQRLANGNTLFLRKTDMPAEILATVKNKHRRQTGQIADSIIEVTPDGDLVWQWHAWDGFDVNYCGMETCEATISEFIEEYESPDTRPKLRKRAITKISDWAHFNTVSVIPENKWFDAGDARFRPGNLIVMPRKFKTVYVIDRETKQPVWQYHGDYKGGLGGAHEPYMIPNDRPGAGNIMIFDNGGLGSHPGESYVLEVNPQTREIEWVYDAGSQFNIRTRGGAQRLLNGNTLISEDPTGKVFEVTPAGETVWVFRSPHPVNRAKRFPYNYCPMCVRTK